MKVQVIRISNSVPFQADGTIEVDACNQFMAETGDECFARNPVTYEATLTHKKSGILLQAKIHAELWLDCVRCNQRDSKDLDINTEILLVPVEDSPKDDEIILGADDLDVSFYENGEIDVDHFILEAIWSECDPHYLCNDDCRGLCPQCGKNLNEGDCDCIK